MPIAKASRSWRGMTLTECLVAVTILGILAVAIVPSAALFAKITQQRDIRQRLVGSWRMAMALAAARQQPVVWQLKVLPSAQTQIALVSPRSEILWQMKVDVTIHPDTQDSETHSVFERTVYAHGLTDPFNLKWQQDSQTLQITLGEAKTPLVTGGSF